MALSWSACEGYHLLRFHLQCLHPSRVWAWLPGVALDGWGHSSLLTLPPPLISCFLLSAEPSKNPSGNLPSLAFLLSSGLAHRGLPGLPLRVCLTLILDSDSSLGNPSSRAADCDWCWRPAVSLHLPLVKILIWAVRHTCPHGILALILYLRSLHILFTYLFILVLYIRFYS